MVKRHLTCALLAFCSLFMIMTSCKEDDPISRRYPCRFTFSKEQHPTSIIFTACQSAGSYVIVTTKVDAEKVRHVYARSNDGKTPMEDNVITTDREANYSAYILGASNDIGLVIGLTNFNGLVAYDCCCPNCSSLHALQFSDNRQKMACSKCGRVYDLETGTIISGDGGEVLMRYGCNYNGAQLTVGN